MKLFGSIAFLCLIAFLTLWFYYVKAKDEMDELAKINPSANFWTHTFGRTWGNLMPVILLVFFVLLSFLVIKVFYMQPL